MHMITPKKNDAHVVSKVSTVTFSLMGSWQEQSPIPTTSVNKCSRLLRSCTTGSPRPIVYFDNTRPHLPAVTENSFRSSQFPNLLTTLLSVRVTSLYSVISLRDGIAPLMAMNVSGVMGRSASNKPSPRPKFYFWLPLSLCDFP